MAKICFLADGQSVHTRRWCNYFTGRGYEVLLISFRNAEISGTQVHFIDCGSINVSGNNIKILLKIPRIRKLIREIQPDIVHALYATSYGLMGALCGRKPFIVTALGSDVLISPFEHPVYKIVLKYIFWKASWITAMSDNMKDVMISLKADPDKISTVIFGIDPAVFNARGRNVPNNHFTITSTRNFEAVYNIDIFIKAIALACKSIPNIQVNLVGAGSMESQVKELINKLELESIIKVHGRISQDRIADLLRSSHLFVSVSSSDGNNISLNEAMACGCFSVVSDIPANRQWIKDGINGYFCNNITAQDIAATIVKAHDTYYEKIAEAAIYNEAIIREKALWSENMKKVERIYDKLLKHE
jgi:L-malate glycosyltransferase